MESNNPPPNKHHEPSSSTFSRLHPPPDFPLFTNHLRPVSAGYMGTVYGGPSQIGGSSYQRVNDYHRHPIGMHEAIWRQIEKEKIREEIIAEELARRHILEAEVRRELMIDRNLVMQRVMKLGDANLAMQGGDGSYYTSYLKSMLAETKGFPALPPPKKMDASRSGEMIGMSALVGNEFGNLETASQRVSEPRTLEFLTPSDTVREKQKIILLGKPEEKISGMKQKSEVLPSVRAKRKAEVFMPVRASELTSAGAALKKRVQEEWSCALCQVSATSERALKEHLRGKRHLAKEAGLRKNGKNFSIGLYPKTIPVPNKLPEIPSSTCLEKIVNFPESKGPKTGTTAESNPVKTQTNNDPVLFRSRKLDRTLKKEAPACKTDFRRTQEQKKFKFWCEMCQIGAYCENVMESHRKGKKHLAHLLEQNTVSKPSTQVMQVKQELNPTEEAGEVVQGSASKDSALIIKEVKLEGYQKEAGEDGGDNAPKGLGVAADEVKLEGNQNEAEKDVKDTTSESLDPVTFVVKLEGVKKEVCEDDAEDTKSEGSDPLINEVELECDRKEESITDADNSD